MFNHPLKYLFIALVFATLTLALQGCSLSKPLTKVVYETKYVHPDMPSEVTQAVKPKAPIAPQEYLAMTVHERESYLTDYAIEVMGGLKMCNAKLLKVQTILDTQKGAYGAHQPPDKVNTR